MADTAASWCDVTAGQDGSSNNRRIKRELKVCQPRICVKRRKGRVIRRQGIETTAATNEKRGKQAECVQPRFTLLPSHVLFVIAYRALSLRSRRSTMIYLAFRSIGSSAEIITTSLRHIYQLFQRNSFNSRIQCNKFHNHCVYRSTDGILLLYSSRSITNLLNHRSVNIGFC